MSAKRALGTMIAAVTHGPWDMERDRPGRPQMTYRECWEACRLYGTVAPEHWWTTEINRMLKEAG